jgi:hypothetical protein
MKTRWLLPSFLGLTLGACSSAPSPEGTGGVAENGGRTSAGGTSTPGTGGALGFGGASSNGGAMGSGGAGSSGGAAPSGGAVAKTGGATSSAGGNPGSGGQASGGSPANGGASGTGGKSGTGGAVGSGGSGDAGVGRDATASGGATGSGGAGSGGAKGTGGVTATGGTTGAGGSTTPPAGGKVFSKCRFHFGTIDSQATSTKNGGATLISQLDFFTPGWMMGTFNQGYVCTEANGALAGLVPVDVTYIAANYVKNQNKLCDCNVSGCSGGNLCSYGSQYITQDWAAILAAYTSNSTGFAACLGGKPIIFEMEPDWYQYTGGGQTQAWTAAQAGTNMTALVNALKSSLPNAVFSMDISPWIPTNGSAWYPNFNMSLFTFINTSGGGTAANSTKIRTNNAMTWAGVSQVTGKPILADTGYGANGGSAGPDTAWDDPTNINARIADGVVSISQYNPSTTWGTTISNVRSQLNAPKVCP